MCIFNNLVDSHGRSHWFKSSTAYHLKLRGYVFSRDPFFIVCIFLVFLRREMWFVSHGRKKVFSTRLDEDLVKKLKHLAVDEGETLGDLLDEAIEDLLKKYEKKAKK